MKKEYLDIVDKKGKIIGKEKRENLHLSPEKIHMAVNVLIVNSKRQTLVQLRSKRKRFGGGLWEISAGGHITSGESTDEAAKREWLEAAGGISRERPVQHIWILKSSITIGAFRSHILCRFQDLHYFPTL